MPRIVGWVAVIALVAIVAAWLWMQRSPPKLVDQLKGFEEEVVTTHWSRVAGVWRCDKGEIVPDVGPDKADYTACVLGLRDYVNKNGFKGVVLGLSGGIDSALCATIAVRMCHAAG